MVDLIVVVYLIVDFDLIIVVNLIVIADLVINHSINLCLMAE